MSTPDNILRILSTTVMQRVEGPRPEPVEASSIEVATADGRVFEIRASNRGPGGLEIYVSGNEIDNETGKIKGCMARSGHLLISSQAANSVQLHNRSWDHLEEDS